MVGVPGAGKGVAGVELMAAATVSVTSDVTFGLMPFEFTKVAGAVDGDDLLELSRAGFSRGSELTR